MRQQVVALVLVAAALTLSGAAAARTQRPSRAALVDCACYDLFAAKPDGTSRQLLSSGGSRDLYDVSPDRTHILYEHVVGILSGSAITGAGARTFATRDSVVDRARFSADGSKIAYLARTLNGCRNDAVHVMSADGSDDRALLGSCGAYFVAWSPDSKRLAFGRFRDASGRAAQLVVANADGSGLHALTGYEAGLSDAEWSRTGERIAYVAERIRMIHVIRVDGSHDIAISRGRAPTWAPVGRKLEYLW